MPIAHHTGIVLPGVLARHTATFGRHPGCAGLARLQCADLARHVRALALRGASSSDLYPATVLPPLTGTRSETAILRARLEIHGHNEVRRRAPYATVVITMDISQEIVPTS